MKLSEMTTAKAADVLLAVAAELEPMLQDTELMAAINKTTTDRSKALETGLQRLTGSAALLLGKYRDRVFRVLAAINDKTPEEIGAQILPETLGQLHEALNDKELLVFFKSSSHTARGK